MAPPCVRMRNKRETTTLEHATVARGLASRGLLRANKFVGYPFSLSPPQHASLRDLVIVHGITGCNGKGNEARLRIAQCKLGIPQHVDSARRSTRFAISVSTKLS